VLAHLAACGSCRRASAQIVQLENQIDVEPISETDEPGRLETLLSRFGSLVPSAGEEVVFAYQNPEEEVVGEETTDEADPQSPDGKTTH
jgi:hypothetical protein